MQRAWLLLVPFGAIVFAACAGDNRSSGEDAGADAGGSDAASSSDGGDAGAEGPCGHPGARCCPAPAVPCGTGTVCGSSTGRCMVSELAVLGEYFDQQQQSHHSVIALYDGKDWTAGPDLVIDSNWWSPTDLVSSAPGNYYVTFVRHGVEGSRDQGKLFNFHSGLWHKCEPGEACVGPEVPSPPFWYVASIADELWISATENLYRCVPGGSCANQPTTYGWGYGGKIVGTGPHDVWYVGEGAGWYHLFHFDGTKWTLHQGMKASTMFAVREDDVWAPADTTLRHWDGKAWSTEYVVEGAPAQSFIGNMSGSSSTDIWAVGTNGFAAHWDGTTWSYRPLPAATAESSSVFSVYAPSPIEAYVATGGTGVYRWDGAQWTKMAMPTVGTGAGIQVSWGFITGPVKPRP